MRTFASTPLHRIHPYFWVAGALAWMAFDIWRSVREEKKPKHIALSTFHPFVPTNLFSKMVEHEHRRLSGLKGSGLSVEWLCVYGDKMSHSLLALCVGLGEIKPLSGTSTEESNRRLFQLLFQATLAETSLQLKERGWNLKRTAPVLDHVATIFISAPLAELEHYRVLLLQDEEQRCETVAQEAVKLTGVNPDNAKHYRAAHVLARTMVMMLVSDIPRA